MLTVDLKEQFPKKIFWFKVPMSSDSKVLMRVEINFIILNSQNKVVLYVRKRDFLDHNQNTHKKNAVVF